MSFNYSMTNDTVYVKLMVSDQNHANLHGKQNLKRYILVYNTPKMYYILLTNNNFWIY
jgi:hypothetical protein